MTFRTQGWGSPDSVSESIFNAYVDAGGNFIDTADVHAHGRSEELIGGSLAHTSQIASCAIPYHLFTSAINRMLFDGAAVECWR